MNTDFTEKDKYFMRIALKLSENGEGRVSPNPPVGCVLVRDGKIIGEGWHDRYGDLHAEAMALQAAGDLARGSTAYVTLSPCTSYGKQPPCADALIRAGIGRLLVAAQDPNPGNRDGVKMVNAAGIPAAAGLLQDEGEYAARGFFSKMRKGLPYLTLKYAMTLDGRIATESGDSRWVSGPASRDLVQDMRSRSDAIMVGSGTVLADDPLLTVRGPALERRGGAAKHPQPTRVIVDSTCRTPPGARLFAASETAGKIIIACTNLAPAAAVETLRRQGAEVIVFPALAGKVPLEPLLRALGDRNIFMILCESGGGMASSLIRDGLVDEVVAFVAPKIVGGTSAPGPVGGKGVARMAEAVNITIKECSRVGDDIMIKGVFR